MSYTFGNQDALNQVVRSSADLYAQYYANQENNNGQGFSAQDALSFLQTDQGQSMTNAVAQMAGQSKDIDTGAVVGLLGKVGLGAFAASNPAGWVALGVTAIAGGTKLVSNYLGQISIAHEKFEKVDSLGKVLANTKIYSHPKKITKSLGELGKGQMIKVFSRSGTSNRSWAYVGVGNIVGYVKYSKIDLVGSDYYSLYNKISPQLLDVFVYRSCEYMYGSNVIPQGGEPCFGPPSLPKSTLVAEWSDSLLPSGVDAKYTAKFEDSKTGELWYWELDPITNKTKSSDVVGYKATLLDESTDSDSDQPIFPYSPTGGSVAPRPDPSFEELNAQMPSQRRIMESSAGEGFPPVLLAIAGGAVALSLLGKK